MKTEYRLKYDLHTHTVFSHGKGTIEDNVRAALEKKLKMIGISDHGPGHVSYGVKRSNISVMRQEIKRLSQVYPDIKILLGIEANIINPSGALDITQDEIKEFDYILAGYHYGVFGENPFFAMGVHGGNYIQHKLGRYGKQQKRKNTELTVKAIYENPIQVLTHPGDKGAFDIGELARACADRGTLMEISTWHDYLSVEGIREAAKTEVQFIISSDAHHPKRIGDFQGAVDRIREAGLDFERVVNLEVNPESKDKTI